MDAIIAALRVGVKVAIWIFRSIFVGYFLAIRWFFDRNEGHHYTFPSGPFLLAVGLTFGLIWFYSLDSGGRSARSTPSRTGGIPAATLNFQRRETRLAIRSTATTAAEQTVAAGGVLPTNTPRTPIPTRTPTTPTSTPAPTLPPTSTYTPTPTFTPTPKPPEIYILPEEQKVVAGQPVVIEVWRDPRGQEVSIVSFELEYDRDKLALLDEDTDITVYDVLDYQGVTKYFSDHHVLVKAFCDYLRDSCNPYVGEEFRIAKIVFQTNPNQTGETQIEFTAWQARHFYEDNYGKDSGLDKGAVIELVPPSQAHLLANITPTATFTPQPPRLPTPTPVLEGAGLIIKPEKSTVIAGEPITFEVWLYPGEFEVPETWFTFGWDDEKLFLADYNEAIEIKEWLEGQKSSIEYGAREEVVVRYWCEELFCTSYRGEPVQIATITFQTQPSAQGKTQLHSSGFGWGIRGIKDGPSGKEYVRYGVIEFVTPASSTEPAPSKEGK